jgi:hypothetical protein
MDWNFLSTLFFTKSSEVIEHQALSLIKSPKTKKRWSKDESELFATIMKYFSS